MGIFGQSKPKEKVVTDKEKIEALMQMVGKLHAEFDEFKRQSQIPNADLVLTQKIMQKINNSLSIEQIYSVLKAFQEIKQDRARPVFDRMMDEHNEKKEEILGIKNCFKCNKALKEGEYYLVDNKAACLRHLQEKPIISNEKGGAKSADKKNIV